AQGSAPTDRVKNIRTLTRSRIEGYSHKRRFFTLPLTSKLDALFGSNANPGAFGAGFCSDRPR
ncbi:MAG: hypothetical protein IJX92_07850, partial [Clostridia bacterium]|nr:hypothetical protein [Clostridia bacterium]